MSEDYLTFLNLIIIVLKIVIKNYFDEWRLSNFLRAYKSKVQSLAITSSYMQLRAITCNHVQLHAITCNYMQLPAITCNYVQLCAITLNYMQLSEM